MATEARRIALAGAEGSVVKEAPAVDNMRRLGSVHLCLSDFHLCLRVDDLDGVVETGQHIQPVCVFIQRESCWSAASHGNLIGRTGNEGVVLELCGVVDRNLTRTDGGDI